jgi:hypothetical protein
MRSKYCLPFARLSSEPEKNNRTKPPGLGTSGVASA